MTLLQSHSPADIASAWNESAGAKYRIDAALVGQNLLDHPLFHEAASFWIEGSFVAIKRSSAKLYAGPDEKVAHLSLLGGANPPVEALRAAVEVLRSEGFEALVVGGDSGHFLPGAPTDIPWLGWFLKNASFERGSLAFDLERDLRDPLASLPFSPNIELRPLTAPDLPSLDRFLQREFPGRWRFDVSRKIEAEGASTIFGLFAEGEVEGFALLQGDGCRLPIGGAVWRLDLGPSWGSLGPIGVSSALRGHSYGIELLNAALLELRRRGSRRAIIDWTGLVDFYGTQGFSVARTYRSYRLNLQADRQS